MTKYLACFTVILLLLCMSNTGKAVRVLNGSTVLFDDDLESYTPAGDAIKPDQPPWDIYQSWEFNTTWVASSYDPGSGAIAAYQGSNFLLTRRLLHAPGPWDVTGRSTATFASQSSGVVTGEFAIYVVSGVAVVQFESGAGLLLYPDRVQYMSGTVWVDTGLASMKSDQWNHLSVSYNIDTQTMDIALNGVAVLGLSTDGTGDAVNHLDFIAAASPAYFLIDQGSLFYPPENCEQVRALGWILPTDLNENCHTDLPDFALLASGWLDCNDPNDPGDPTCKDRQDWP